MADVTLSYKDTPILELSDSGNATLKTGGTYCEDDIAVEYVKPSGGGDEQGLVDLVFDYTDGTRSWSGVIENNTIKSTTASAWCSPPLLLKKPIVIKTGDVVEISIKTNIAMFANIGFMQPCINLTGSTNGSYSVATNVYLTSRTYSYTWSGADIIADRMFIVNRNDWFPSTAIVVIGLSINGTVIF